MVKTLNKGTTLEYNIYINKFLDMSQLRKITPMERNIIIPFVINLLEKTNGEGKQLYAQEIVDEVNGEMFAFNNKPYKLHQSILRKIMNHIRINSILPVISGNKGYYISYDKQDVFNMVESLESRANSIQSSADGLKKFLEN